MYDITIWLWNGHGNLAELGILVNLSNHSWPREIKQISLPAKKKKPHTNVIYQHSSSLSRHRIIGENSLWWKQNKFPLITVGPKTKALPKRIHLGVLAGETRRRYSMQHGYGNSERHSVPDTLQACIIVSNMKQCFSTLWIFSRLRHCSFCKLSIKTPSLFKCIIMYTPSSYCWSAETNGNKI